MLHGPCAAVVAGLPPRPCALTAAGLPPSWARRPGASADSVAAFARKLYGDDVDIDGLRCFR